MLGDVMGAGPSDSTLLMMPLFHIGAKSVQLGQHLNGGIVHIHERFDAAAVLNAIYVDGITITLMAPTMVQMLLDDPGASILSPNSLKRIIYSSAPMPESLLRRGLSVFGPIFSQVYGQTEGAGTALRAEEHVLDGSLSTRLRSVGRAFLDAKLIIGKEDDSPCPTGEVGEIMFDTPAKMAGYWNNSAATVEALKGGLLHTGDMGYVDEDGYLYLVDRKKDMIISGGENVYAKEVEDVIYSSGLVKEVAVVGQADSRWGEAVTAIVVRLPGSALSERDVITLCISRMARYKCPKRVVFVEELPRVASGKVDKVTLRSELNALASATES